MFQPNPIPLSPGGNPNPIPPVPYSPDPFVYDPTIYFWLHPFGGALSLVFAALWIWALYDCLRTEPERNVWLWILIIMPPVGVVVYFLVRKLPMLNIRLPGGWQKWTRQHEILEAQAAVRNIGNSYQYVKLAELLVEIDDLDGALKAFAQALAKDQHSLPALWGISQVLARQANFAASREHLQVLLKLDASYKYGDAHLAYCRALWELEENEPAREQLEKYLVKWNHPEGRLLLARVLQELGSDSEARRHAERVLDDLYGAPKFNAGRNRQLIASAKKLLATLDAPPASK